MENSSTPEEKTVVVETEDVAGKESRNIAVMVWIGTLFLGFIPSLIVYFAYTINFGFINRISFIGRCFAGFGCFVLA